jgi:hypothetical protein
MIDHSKSGGRGNAQRTENVMRPFRTAQAEHARLRFVFNDKVVSLTLGAHATMGDIALVLSAFSPLDYGTPIAINVTMREAGPGPNDVIH